MAGCKTNALTAACGIALAASPLLEGNVAAQAFSSGTVLTVEADDHVMDRTLSAPSLEGPAAVPRAESRGSPATQGNPLWTTSLESLSATRERPIFLPSRRPAARPVVVIDLARAPVTLPTQPQPERLGLGLIGTVVVGAEGIAVFLDEATKGVVRLRTGDSHSGWMLRSVRRREATVEKGAERVRLAFSPAATRELAELNPPPSLPPSPPPFGVRAPPATTARSSRSPTSVFMAQKDGVASSPVAPPPFADRAPPATNAGPSTNPDGSPAPPPFVNSASPAMTRP